MTSDSVYSLQVDANGNRIVCKGTQQRAGTYRIVLVGTWKACNSTEVQ